MKKLIFLLYFSLLLLPTVSQASDCTILSQNSSAVISLKSTIKCIEFRGINYSNTYFTADSSFQNNAAYNIAIKNSSGATILNKMQKAAGKSTNLKLNTYYSTVRIYLEPITQNINYEFFIVHDENTSTNETVIYIGLNSEYVRPFIEPKPPCSGCWVNGMPTEPSASSLLGSMNNHHTMASSSSDTPQCTDANRPPESTPFNRKTEESLNINGVLRTSRNWYAGMKKTHSTTGAIAGGFARLVAMHRAGGALDLAHDDESDYVGSAEMGNFLYGANGRAMGLPGWVLIRGAAGYQAISNHGYTWRGFSQGVVNFIQNEGDNQGDPAQTIRGIKYHDEVFIHNINNSNKMSCQDIESKNENSTPTSPGGGGGEGGNSGGRVIIGGGGGSKTCFVQDGFVTYCWAN